jgi:hypothetical protein
MCPNRHLFLELISILILKNGVIFGYVQILHEEDVVLILEERDKAWRLYQAEIGLNMQVLHWITRLVDFLAIEERCTRQVEEDTLFLTS